MLKKSVDNPVRNFLLTCRNPRVVDTARGSTLSSCGRCPECMKRKSGLNTINAIQESAEHRYTGFAFLSYNDACVPVAKIIEKREKTELNPDGGINLFSRQQYTPNKLYFIDYTRRKLHPTIVNSPYVESSTYKQILFSINGSFKNKLFKRFYDKSRSHSKIFKRKPFKYINILCKEDLQKFLKRLRFHIRKDFGSEIRFFACGEYGPQTFRPHYHIIFYFDDPRLVDVMQDYIRKCWQYGDSNYESARTINGTANYAASYCNGTTNLPSFYQNKSIKPFTIHSKHFGTLTNKEISKYVNAFDLFPMEPFTISTTSGLRNLCFTSSVKSYLFPRCYDYVGKVSRISSKLFRALTEKMLPESTNLRAHGGQTLYYFGKSQLKTTDFYKTYALYPYLSQKYGTTKLFDLARYFLIYETKYLYLLGLTQFIRKDNDKFSDYPPEYDEFLIYDPTQFELAKDEIDDYHISIMNRVYTALLKSRQVVRNSQSSGLSFTDYLIKILSFYYQFEQYKLNKQFTAQQQYYQDFHAEDFSIFYINDFNDKIFEQRFEHNGYIKQFKIESLIEINNKVKHKELNDANEIFTQI